MHIPAIDRIASPAFQSHVSDIRLRLFGNGNNTPTGQSMALLHLGIRIGMDIAERKYEIERTGCHLTRKALFRGK